jgi:hypothetical protein
MIRIYEQTKWAALCAALALVWVIAAILELIFEISN